MLPYPPRAATTALDPWIGERRRELAFPAPIVAGEVSRAAQQAWIPRDVVPLGEDPETGVEALAIEGSGRRHDGHAIAGREPRGLDEARRARSRRPLGIDHAHAGSSPAIVLQVRRLPC